MIGSLNMAISYHFICDKCGTDIEEEQSIKEKLRSECPYCGSEEPIFHQVYQETQPYCKVKEVNCVGIQAEVNARRDGKELHELRGKIIRNKYKDAKFKVQGHGGKAKGRPGYDASESESIKEAQKFLNKKAKNVKPES
jgi:DNA-directed RNA polymerase subunit RPC12/RpoP